MQQFIAKFKDQIEGSLCGFDRLVLSGTLRRMSHARGMDTYLSEFRMYRPKEGGPEEEKHWLPLRKCIADMARRAEVCQRANERYLDAMAQVDATATLVLLGHKIDILM